MNRGRVRLLGDFAQPLGKHAGHAHAIRIRMHHQAMARRGRERHGGDQLGIVRDARAVRTVRPGEVPDEFAHAVVLEIERHRAHQVTILAGDENARLPASPRAHAARPLQRGQKGMFEEWIVLVDQLIPRRRRHLGDARKNRKRERRFGDGGHGLAKVYGRESPRSSDADWDLPTARRANTLPA